MDSDNLGPMLYPGNSYTTPEGKAGPIASFFPSLALPWFIQQVIRHDGRLAKAGLYDNAAWVEGSHCTIQSLERCGVKLFVEGMDNIDKTDGPCLFIANHMSTLETFVLPAFIQPRKNVTFVVKKSLVGYPWFGPVLQSRNPIIVGRDNPREDLSAVLEGGAERLEQGTSIIIFPQSTRSSEFDRSKFNSIGVKLAKRTGVPVVPVALRSDAWGNGAIIKDLGKVTPAYPVHFEFGEPMNVQGAGKEEHARICEFIEERVRKWNLPVPNAM